MNAPLPPKPKPAKRRRLSFSLRTFLLLTTVSGVALSYAGNIAVQARMQRAAVEKLEMHGWEVWYDDIHACGLENSARRRREPLKRWIFGRDAVNHPWTAWEPDEPASPNNREVLEALTRLPTISSVTLQHRRLTGSDVAKLAVMPQLQHLVLNHCEADGDALRELSKLRLQSLYCEGPEFTDETLAGIAGISSLRTLDLQDTSLTAEGIERIVALPVLEHLAIGGSLDDEKANSLDAGLKHIGAHPRLFHIRLSRTDVSNAGVAHLANNRNLITVDLSSTRVSNACIKDLASLSKLHSVDVSRTPITDDAPFDELFTLKHLSRLELGPKVSFAKAQELKTKYFRCDIIHHGEVGLSTRVELKASPDDPFSP